MKLSTEKIIYRLFENYPSLKSCEEPIVNAVEIIKDAFAAGKKLLVCGNGGSASDAMHIAGELLKSFVLPRPIPDKDRKALYCSSENAKYIADNIQGALPVISLVSEIALTTAYSNDVAADLVFAQQVYGYGNCDDVLLAISTSGNSSNIIYACDVAKIKDMKVISLTGKSGGKLKAISDVCINVPEDETYRVQELHLPVYHTICLGIENEFFGS